MSSRPPRFTGLFYDESAPESCWIRDTGIAIIPALDNHPVLALIGELLPGPAGVATAAGSVGLELKIDGKVVFTKSDIALGQFRIELPWPAGTTTAGHKLEIKLLGVAYSNFLAWLGRVSGLSFLQAWRMQGRNHRLRIQRIGAGSEILFDFSNRAAPWNLVIARSSLKVGLNLVGYFRAILGVGESVRCAARAADAAGLPVACIDLKLPCRNAQTDITYSGGLQSDNPHPVNIFHLDAPGAKDIDHHHGASFRAGKYNIGYWAWELTEFPETWTQYADYFDEIWTPSQFATEAIAQKLPIPVLTMPHAISFKRPQGDYRNKFGLPADKYLFLFLYDLNSYSERKNPTAVLEAFRLSGLAGRGAALVIKVHNVASNPIDFSRLREACATLADTTIIAQSLSREEVYELESSCDCFVSLHRSEGFGLAIAESMYLGKPVISTDWSASAEFVHEGNGCPVRYTLVKLDRSHGPYSKGQTWAEPDIAHAAEWMQRLFADRSLGLTLGASARVTMEQKFSPAAIGVRYRRRLEAIAGW
ncbi:MAG: glycosyltransferase family 4 protein [Opitutae bacterium]